MEICINEIKSIWRADFFQIDNLISHIFDIALIIIL